MNADELIEFRKRFGLSRTKMAELIGCSARSISNWEKGVNKIPDSIALAASAVALNLPRYGSATKPAEDR